MTGDDLFAAIARRLAGFGAVARMTGFGDVVSFDGPDLRYDDGGGNGFRMRRSGGRLTIAGFDETAERGGDFVVEVEPEGHLSGTAPPVLQAWLSDAAAGRELTDWVEQFIEDAAMDLVIRRDELADMAVDPFSRHDVDRLIAAFPLADAEDVHHFLRTARHWISSGL